MKILLVEDELRLAKNIASGLEAEGYTVDSFHDGSQGYDLATTGDYDLIILDLMLPGMDGLTICKKLRQEKITTPILMLTAKSTIDDKVLGLNTGADDYLTKPFDFEELLARIKALSRRPVQIQSPDSVLGSLASTLSQKELQVLEYLVKNKHKWVNKSELISRVWPYDSDVLENTVEVTIKNIRHKLNPAIIQTRRGLGYKYNK